MEHVPGGIDPPAHVPRELFSAALAAYEEGRRLDMGALAAELGIGRATLYRRAGSRQRLLGEVLWFRTRQVLAHALGAAEGLTGAARIVAIFETYLRIIHDRPALLALLEREHETALRLITSQQSPVHSGLVKVVASVLAEEQERGAIALTIDVDTLAYVIVRIGESLIYADRPAETAPDHRAPVDVVARLLAGSQVGALPSPQAAGETTGAVSRDVG
jgi:AcrR family transcriptional regulator